MKFINRFIFVLVGALFIANIIIYVKSLRLASGIKRFESEINSLQFEVEKLQDEALTSESLSNIASKAAQLGFGNAREILRIGSIKVALKE